MYYRIAVITSFSFLNIIYKATRSKVIIYKTKNILISYLEEGGFFFATDERSLL